MLTSQQHTVWQRESLFTSNYVLFFFFGQGFYDVLRRNSQLASSIMQTLFTQVHVCNWTMDLLLKLAATALTVDLCISS